MQPILGGRGDARLVAAVEGDDLPRRRTAGVGRRPRGRGRIPPPAAAATPPTPADASSARRVRAIASRRAPSPAPGDSGSASASITTLRRRTWGVRSVGVGDEAVTTLGAAAAPRRPARSAVDLGHQRGVPARQRRADRVERRAGALDVGLEVEQVDVRVALLLAGDLRLGDLAQQLVGAVADLRGLELDRPHEPLQLARVGHEAVGQLRGSRGRLRHPQPALDRVKARPPGLRDVVGARVDARVEVAEGLGHGLDALVGHARDGIRAPRRAEVAARQRGAQALHPGDQRGGLALQEGAVAVDAALQVGRERGAGARAAHRQRGVLVVRAGAAQRVAAGLQRQREAPRQPVGDVLDLASVRPPWISSYSVAFDEPLLVTTNVVGAGGEPQRRRLAAGVGDRDVDRPAGAPGDWRRRRSSPCRRRASRRAARPAPRRRRRRRPCAHARAHARRGEDDGQHRDRVEQPAHDLDHRRLGLDPEDAGDERLPDRARADDGAAGPAPAPGRRRPSPPRPPCAATRRRGRRPRGRARRP